MKNYELYLTDDQGRRIALLNNISFMSVSRSSRGFGTIHLGIPFEDFKVFPFFLPDRRVEVWRAPHHGASLRDEGSYLLRKFNVYTRDEDNVQIIEFWGRSPIDILRRGAVTSTTLADYQKTDEIDDMMKDIVQDSLITPAISVPSGEMTVDGSDADGPIITHSFFGQNILDIMNDLRDISFTKNAEDSNNARIYFDVVRGAPLATGGFGYIFRTYAGLRGTDRRTGVVFSPENGNVTSVAYYEDHLDSFTKAQVLNLSTPAANGEATHPDANLSRWNTIVTAQQTSETDPDVNDSKAFAVVESEKADKAFNGSFVDSPGSSTQPRSLYGVDWDLGDLLPVRYANKDLNVEVKTVYISIDKDGKENIVGMGELRVTPADTLNLDPYLVSLLHMNGADGDSAFTDEKGKVWTANGNAQIDTAQSVFGGASGLFDGTGDYLSTADSLDWQLDGGSNSNAWTIDFRIRFNGDPGTAIRGLAQQRQDANNRLIFYFENNLLRFAVVSGGVVIISIDNAWNPAGDTWYHVELVKQGTTGYKAFIDGIQIGSTQIDTSTLPNLTGNFEIGRIQDAAGTSSYHNGWLDEFRISKGVARWTSNFTPPTEEYTIYE